MSQHFPEVDRCIDVIDQACQTEERMRDNDIAKARARSRPEQVRVPLNEGDAEELWVWPITECVVCSDDIPPERLDLGRIRCVICQGALERKRAQQGT